MLWARGLWSCVCLSPRAFPSIFPMGYGGSVGLELGWPELGIQIACGSCLAHRCASLGGLLCGTAVVLDWRLVGQNSALRLLVAPVRRMDVPRLGLSYGLRRSCWIGAWLPRIPLYRTPPSDRFRTNRRAYCRGEAPNGGGLIQGTFLTRNHAKNGMKHIVVPCRFLADLVLGWNVAESTVRLSVDVTCVSRRTHACAVRFTPHGRSPCYLACMSGLSCAVHMPEIVRCTLHRNSWY